MSDQETISRHQKAYVCKHVFNRSAPVLLVSRPEGDWCFLCGQIHDQSAGEYRVVGIGHLFDQDSTLLDVENLPADWEAEREALGGRWLRIAAPKTGRTSRNADIIAKIAIKPGAKHA